MSFCKSCGNTHNECECISHEVRIHEAVLESRRRNNDDSIQFGDRRWSAGIIVIMLENM